MIRVLLTVLVMSSAAHAETVADFKLGCTVEEAAKVVLKSPAMSLALHSRNGRCEDVMIEGGSLKIIRQTTLYFVDGKLCQMQISFNAGTTEKDMVSICEAKFGESSLLLMREWKYHQTRNGVSLIVFRRNVFATHEALQKTRLQADKENEAKRVKALGSL